MYDPLGLSIGTTNFVAVRAGHPPVRRRALLTLVPHRAAQIGTAAEHSESCEHGLPIAGFVEQVGEPEPLVAADGSVHRPEVLLADAVDAMLGAAGAASEVTIAVPAHWAPPLWQMFEQALRAHTGLAAFGAPPFLVSDAVAALTALEAECGVPDRGVLALLDFGGSGTSVTLAEAAAGFDPIDETLRYQGFSGNGIDQAMAAYLLEGDPGADAGPGGTAMVGEFGRLADECRRAKERLSRQSATELANDLTGARASTTVTRAELEQLIRRPLDGVLAALDEVLQRNQIASTGLAAVATVGGGAHIPLVTERLTASLRVPVLTARRPALAIAAGAMRCGQRAEGTRRARTAVPTPAMAMTLTSATATATAFAGVSMPDSGVERSGAVGPLAWSQEDVGADYQSMPLPGAPYGAGFGADYGADWGADYSADLGAEPDPAPPPPSRRRPRTGRAAHRLPQLLVGAAAMVATTAAIGVVYTVTVTAGTSGTKAPSQPATSVGVPVLPPTPAAIQPSPVAPPPVVPSPEPAPPPPPPPPNTPAPTTTRQPPATTTPAPTSTTAPATTTPSPTTSAPTTSAPMPTTTPPETTSLPPSPTTPTVSMTTEYLTIPFVPVPIPIQVPAN